MSQPADRPYELLGIAAVSWQARDTEFSRADESEVQRLRRLHDQYFDAIWRYVRRLGLGAAEADDATQQAFIVLARKLTQVESDCERSFLYSTAFRIAWDTRRKAARRHELMGLEEEEPYDVAPGPDALLEERRARALLDEILAAMRLEFRVVFVLFEVEGFTMSEIAEVLEIPVGTVASRLRRARVAFDQYTRRLRARDAQWKGGP